MNKLIIRLSEVVAIVCLIAFILFVSGKEELSKTEPGHLSEQVISVADTDGLIIRNGLYVKKKYGIDTERLEHITLYSSDSVMDVREYMILKPEPSYTDEVVDIIEKALKDKQTLFEDYAPEQSALLSSGVLINEKGYILLAVGEDASTVLAAFRSSL